MRELGLVPCQPRPKRFNLTQAAAGQVPDLVGRNFTADAPGEKLVGDITYIATGEGWVYLATVIDCCTKEVIGYAMDDHYQTALISRAIRNAARNRNLSADTIFHSDSGSNDMSASSRIFCVGSYRVQQVSRKGLRFCGFHSIDRPSSHVLSPNGGGESLQHGMMT